MDKRSYRTNIRRNRNYYSRLNLYKMKYRKKPVEIEAVQYDGNFRCLDIFSIHEVENFIIGTDEAGNPCLKIPTLEGVMTVSKGDYVIRGVKGEYYPCKPDIFEMTYEKV